MTLLMIAALDLLIIKPYDHPDVERRNFPIHKCLDGFISVFSNAKNFTNDLAFVRFIKCWRHDVRMHWNIISAMGCSPHDYRLSPGVVLSPGWPQSGLARSKQIGLATQFTHNFQAAFKQ